MSVQKDVVESCTQIIEARVRGTITPARNRLRRNSLKPVVNAFWKIPCGGTREHGIYLSCFPELLHQMEGGMMEIFLTAFVKYFKSLNETRVVQMVTKLNRRAKRLSRLLSRQSDRSVPMKYFPKGVTDFTGLSSQEFPDLILLLICTIGCDQTVITDIAAEKKWKRAAWQLLLVWTWLKKDKYDKDELPHLQAAIVTMMRLFKEVAEPYIPSGCKFPKFHLSLHYVLFIKLFGPPLYSYGGFWERSMKTMIKKPFQRTSKNNDTAREELRKRHRLVSAISKRTTELNDFEKRYCNVTADPAPVRHGSQIQLCGSSIDIIEAIPDVYTHAAKCFEDIYDFSGTLGFRTEVRIRLEGNSKYSTFRAHPQYKKKGPWFDFAIVRHSDVLKLAQIFVYIEPPQGCTTDALMICTILECTGIANDVRLKQYKTVKVHTSNSDTPQLKYKLLPVSSIMKTAFVFPHQSGSDEFTLIPSLGSWLEEITPSNFLEPLDSLTTDLEFQVRSILKKKKVICKQGRLAGRTTQIWYLVEWDGYHKCESTWVRRSNIDSHLVSEYERRNS